MFEKLKKGHRKISAVMLFVSFPAAFFYLFILPMWTALNPNFFGVPGIAFAAFMLIQLFMLVLEITYEVAAQFYNFPNPHLFRFMTKASVPFLTKTSPIGPRKLGNAQLIISMFLSYIMFLYAFSVLYVFISNVDPNSFGRQTGLSAFDGFYFSTVTATTVGYGDIAPESTFGKAVTVVQIFMSFTYVIFIFSASSSYLREKRQEFQTES